MAVPAYVNAGTLLNNNVGSSATPTLPGSRVNGNTLLAVAMSRASGGSGLVNACATTGWHPVLENVDTVGGAGTAVRFSVYYCLIDGTEVEPVITGQGGSNVAQVFQFSGLADPGDILGNYSTNYYLDPVPSVAVSSLTVTCDGITTSRSNSLAVYVFVQRGGTITESANYTEHVDNSVNGCSIVIGSTVVNSSGDYSGDFSATSSPASVNDSWAMAVFELKAPLVEIPPIDPPPSPAIIQIFEENDLTYYDFVDVYGAGVKDYESYFLTGAKVHGEGHRSGVLEYITVFANVEEDGSCKIRGKYDWSNSGSSGKWSTEQQVYSASRDFRDVSRKRLLIRGSGPALQLHFRSEAGKPFDLIGWSTWESVDAIP